MAGCRRGSATFERLHLDLLGQVVRDQRSLTKEPVAMKRPHRNVVELGMRLRLGEESLLAPAPVMEVDERFRSAPLVRHDDREPHAQLDRFEQIQLERTTATFGHQLAHAEEAKLAWPLLRLP
ncbi:hypothetical protein D3C83_08410 [compost metagenome]